MAATGSIRVVKQFTYRGETREFSNRYFFTGHTPSNSTEWTGLSDALVALEAPCYPPTASGGAEIVHTYGYDVGSDVPVFDKAYTTDGTCSTSLAQTVPGDVAALVRYSTAARSSKNHPIYLFNYYHAAQTAGGAGGKDTVAATTKTGLDALADAWVNGISDGTNFYSRTSPVGHNATGYVTESLLTHRDLPR